MAGPLSQWKSQFSPRIRDVTWIKNLFPRSTELQKSTACCMSAEHRIPLLIQASYAYRGSGHTWESRDVRRCPSRLGGKQWCQPSRCYIVAGQRGFVECYASHSNNAIRPCALLENYRPIHCTGQTLSCLMTTVKHSYGMQPQEVHFPYKEPNFSIIKEMIVSGKNEQWLSTASSAPRSSSIEETFGIRLPQNEIHFGVPHTESALCLSTTMPPQRK